MPAPLRCSARRARDGWATTSACRCTEPGAGSAPTRPTSSSGSSIGSGSAAHSRSSRSTNGCEREEAPREPVAQAWDRALAGIPADWSDLLCELQLTSTDHLARGALLTAPINPTRVPDRTAFRFRVARTFGYGASSQMTRRCFERLDSEGIPATLTLLHVLSDTHNVATQGPVWRVAGKAV